MTSIPMTAAGLKEQYEQYLKEEGMRRFDLQRAKQGVARMVTLRKEAYRRWQKAIERKAP